MTEHAITDTEYAIALEAGRRAADSEFRAQAIFYVAYLDAIEIITVKDGGFVIPRRLIGALQDVEVEHLGTMELWPDGSVIEIDALDIHISVDGMVKAALPVLIPSRIVDGLLDVYGQAERRAAKPASSRRGGKGGGARKKTAAA